MISAAIHKAKEWIDKYGVYWVRALCGQTGKLTEDINDVTCRECRAEYVKRKGEV